jgi:hypothetical protein
MVKLMKTQTNRLYWRPPMPHPEPAPSGGPPPPPPPPPPPGPPPPNGDWYKGAPEDVRAYVDRNKFPDVVAALQSGMNAEKMIGVPADQVIRRPSSGFDVDPKPHVAALRVLGAPEKGEAYAADKLFAPVDGLGQIPADTQKAVTTKFAELGILPWQAQGLMSMFTDMSKAQKTTMDAATAAIETERQGRLDAYKATLGGKFEPTVKSARALIAKFDKPIAGEAEALKAKGHLRTDANGVILQDKDGRPIPKGELEAWLDETGAGSDPRMIDYLARIAERFDPSGLTSDPGRNLDQPGAMSKAQAQEELRKLDADQGFQKQLTTRGDPGHKAAVDKRTELLRIAHS